MLKTAETVNPLSQALMDEDSTATVLAAILMDKFGAEFLNWDPATLELEVMDEFGVNLSRKNLDKLNALVTALSTNQFYNSYEAFHYIANALNGSAPEFGTFDPVTAEEAAWAITEVRLNDEPTEEEQADPAEYAFSDEVKTYLGVILDDEGLKPFGVLSDAIMPYQPGSEDQFEDDPIMYSAVWEGRKRDEEAVEQYVQNHVMYTIQRVLSLPLKNIDRKKFQKWLNSFSR